MSSGLVIAERVDIHKSCKSIEHLVNILNDYCQVADTLVALQKKLAKALRDSAASKATATIPASALLTTATIFEGLSEVDTKFVKLADKECDSVSNEVRKWFKKLAKEEKAHDEKISNANAKIKQAGQLYEKKAKKSPRDAQEEHARYVTLVSVLGPEVSHEKYSHSLSVNKRHTALLHGVAAALSRVADAEWLRSCEQVRRSAPTIGQLGEWRSLCEGGWSGPVPLDLPHVDSHTGTTEKEVGDLMTSLEKLSPEYSSRGPSEQARMQEAQDGTVDKGNTLTLPPPQYTSPNLQPRLSDVDRTGDRHDTTLASLASFPAPPTHFPLPPFTTLSDTPPLKPPNTRPSDNREVHLSALSPASRDDSLADSRPKSIPSSAAVDSSPQSSVSAEESIHANYIPSSSTKLEKQDSLSNETHLSSHHASNARLLGDSDPLVESPRPSVHRPESPIHDSKNTAEFGLRRRNETARPSPESARAIERTDTGRSNGSVVAALRDRYARSPGSSSSSPKEVVKLPLSVSSLATRYDGSGDASASPRSPERYRLSTDQSKTPAHFTAEQSIISTSMPTSPSYPSPAAASRTKEHGLDAEDQRLYERERRIRLREDDVERKAKELEYERLLIRRDAEISGRLVDPPPGDYARYPRPQVNSPSSSPRPFHQLHSYSATNLATTHVPTSPTQYATRVSPQHSRSIEATDHAPSCGCETCSTSKYANRERHPSPHDLRPPEPPIALRPEKPKGWIRRLSMPVMGNTFSSDSKKGIGNIAISHNASSGPYRNSLALPDEDGRIRHALFSPRNRSTTTLGR